MTIICHDGTRHEHVKRIAISKHPANHNASNLLLIWPVKQKSDSKARITHTIPTLDVKEIIP